MPQADPTPLVSIQIPTYDRPDYVALSLRSAMEQTYEHLEIIVSDDASPTDEIEAVVREVGAGDARVRYLRQPVNLGGLGNFIAAFQASRGEYLKCLCDDDLLHPRHVAELVGPLVDDPRLTLAFSYFDHIDEHGRRLPDPPGYGRWSETPAKLSGLEIARTSLATNQNLVGSTTATLFSRRRVALPHIMRYGGVEISHYVTDWAMWLSLLAAGPVFYSPEALSQTREHPDRVTHRSSHIFDRVNDLLLVQEHWAAHADDIDRPAKLQALNMIIGMSLQLAAANVDAPEA
ncbi:MAG: hypothetical protein JWN72_862, partial [Thermoleophilia bacterium]|nr:hypothetical protein [Thermoleophilia bacterium]